MKKQYDISIIIVNYRSDLLLIKCLKSIQVHLKSITYEVIIVSNSKMASANKTKIDNIKMRKKIIELEKNVGFPTANNIGRQFSHSRNLLLLNPDTLLIDDTVVKMVSYFKAHQNIGIMGPKLVDENNKKQLSYFTKTTFVSIVFDELYLSKLKCLAFHYYNRKEFQIPKKVQAVSGACMLIRNNYFSGTEALLDEKLFWIEDDEICLRMKAKGYDIIYYPNTSIIHYGDKNNKKASKIKIFNQYLGKIKLFQKYNKSFSVKFLKIFFFLIFQIKKMIFFLSENGKEKLVIYTELEKEIFKVKYND